MNVIIYTEILFNVSFKILHYRKKVHVLFEIKSFLLRNK